MLKGTQILFRQILKQFIWETFNRHRQGCGANIALVGSRRSGSTLLMQIIAHHKGMKYIDQPFSMFTATSPQMHFLHWPAGGLFVSPTPTERENISEYLSGICSGDIHVHEPWEIWRPYFHFKSDRVILKTTDAHHILDLLEESNFKPILYFRHPIPHSLSCARNNWGDKLDFFCRNSIIINEVLDDAQKSTLIRLTERKDSSEDLLRYVLCWCIENMPLFDALHEGYDAVFYENLVLHPDATIDRITAMCGINSSQKMRDMIGSASASVRGLSDREGSKAIRSGNVDALIGRWRAKLDEKDLGEVQDILDLFPRCPYRAAEILPTFDAR